MSKEKTTPKPADDVQDAIVESDPGEAERTLAADQQQDEGGQKQGDDDGDSKAPEYFKDEARNAIFDNAKKTNTRRSVGTYQGTDQPVRAFPKQEDDAVVEAAETLADAPERKTTAEPARISDGDLDKLVPVTAYGKTEWVKLRELQADAQKNNAVGSKLNEVKDLADRFERLRDDFSKRTSPPSTADTGQSDERQDDQNQIDLRDVVDKIQTGTLEEGAKALEGLLARTKGAEQMSPQQIAQIARQTVEQADTDKSLVHFSESVGHDFVEDENLQHMMQGVARKEMLKDLESILPKEHLDKLDQMGRSNPAFVRTVHARARQTYPGRLRDDVTLMQASHGEASRILGRSENTRTTERTPAPPASSVRPAPELRARQEVKRQIVQSPARRTAPAAQSDARPVSQEDRRSQRVAEMRKSRGQPT